MELGHYAGYILGAYGFATLVIAGLILNAVRDNHAQKRALAELQGGTREELP